MKKLGKFFAGFLCIVLAAALVYLLLWNREKSKEEQQNLQELARQESAKQEIVLQNSEQEQPEGMEQEEEEEETFEEDESEPESFTGIVCWGDELIDGEDSATESYRVYLQNLLTDKGYTLRIIDKTLQGAGTLSMMTMAGVPENEVQTFITLHRENAAGEEIPITETGIRDFTPEQLERNDLECIPVIFMGYYGGWNSDPSELVQQQEKILNTFPQQEKFVIVGTAPMDGGVDSLTLDAVMEEKWGEHYVSVAKITDVPATSYDVQPVIAQSILDKLEALDYIE